MKNRCAQYFQLNVDQLIVLYISMTIALPKICLTFNIQKYPKKFDHLQNDTQIWWLICNNQR